MIFLLEFSKLNEFQNISHIIVSTEETKELFSKIQEDQENQTEDIQYIYDSEQHILTKYIDQKYHMIFKCPETLINFLIQLGGIQRNLE